MLLQECGLSLVYLATALVDICVKQKYDNILVMYTGNFQNDRLFVVGIPLYSSLIITVQHQTPWLPN